MRHGLPSLRGGFLSALILLGSTCARVLPRQGSANADVTTAQATTTYAIPLEPTSNIAPSVTFSMNATTTAASAAATGSVSGLPTKHYEFEFTKGWVDTNGNPREAILINGQTPGPLIEAEEGQQLTVRCSHHQVLFV